MRYTNPKWLIGWYICTHWIERSIPELSSTNACIHLYQYVLQVSAVLQKELMFSKEIFKNIICILKHMVRCNQIFQNSKFQFGLEEPLIFDKLPYCQASWNYKMTFWQFFEQATCGENFLFLIIVMIIE